MQERNQLANIITKRINQEGPVSFRDFMEMCLYYPNLGYYTSARDKISMDGDFVTSCNLTASFGAMIGKQLKEIWHLMDKRDFTVVEYGAGVGMLCQDILDYLKDTPELYGRLRYCIIEISPDMIAQEKQLLKEKEKVSWYSKIIDIEGEVDCVLSNELLDNFPVHQVVMKEELMEVFIDYDGDFKEILRPASKKLKEYFDELKVCLPGDFRTEVNLDAIYWINEIAAKLTKGFLLTIDYGGLSEDLYKYYRRCGTILCYHNHKIFDQPFIQIGEQDITSHVNFSALIHWGAKVGLYCCGITSQTLFLLSLGFRDHLLQYCEKHNKNIYQIAMEEAYIMRTLLFDMGQKFKVLIQSRNMPAAKISGLATVVNRQES